VITLDVKQRAGWHVLTITGELDVATAPQVRNEIVALLTDGATDLVLDLTGVPFVDSFGLGVLVGALKRTRNSGGRLVLVTTEPPVLQLLALTGLDTVFEVVDTVDDALAG
jgi:anti-sigma B factor antagonist